MDLGQLQALGGMGGLGGIPPGMMGDEMMDDYGDDGEEEDGNPFAQLVNNPLFDNIRARMTTDPQFF
jgi:hypothetical protein